MRHLRKTPQAKQESIIGVGIEDLQGRQQRVPRIFNGVTPNRSVVAQRIGRGLDRFCDLQLHAFSRPKSLDVQTVGELYSVGSPDQFIVTGIEAARLPIAGNIDVGKLGEKEVKFRSGLCLYC